VVTQCSEYIHGMKRWPHWRIRSGGKQCRRVDEFLQGFRDLRVTVPTRGKGSLALHRFPHGGYRNTITLGMRLSQGIAVLASLRAATDVEDAARRPIRHCHLPHIRVGAVMTTWSGKAANN